MAATKQIPAAVSDLILNDIATGTMVLYTTMTTNPANAGAITGVILTRSGLTGTDYTKVSASAIGSSASVEVEAAAAPIVASGTGTATCIIVKTGTTATDGVIKAITTGSTAMTSGQSYTPSAFTLTVPAAA
ncbi:MAG: hypothetical protein A2075_12465 [Geobacteraceae bacterium GWC2_58_44]|nr:MAG: hypothetical protein A2075_12465 [Geobacteraceae bacterium GWC2_58_44]HBG06905.1 hypothetical protein [Geobacter sp.]